jgi:hypothetical protein
VFDEGVEHDSRGGCAPHSNVAAQSAANFRRNFKWRLSPESRYAETDGGSRKRDGRVAHAAFRMGNGLFS